MFEHAHITMKEDEFGCGGRGLRTLTGRLLCTGISFVFKHHPQALIASLDQLTTPPPLDVLTF